MHCLHALFVFFCAFALVTCSFGSDMLNLADCGHVDSKQSNSAVSTSFPLLCKGKQELLRPNPTSNSMLQATALLVAAATMLEKHVLIKWSGLTGLYSDYRNVELNTI